MPNTSRPSRFPVVGFLILVGFVVYYALHRPPDQPKPYGDPYTNLFVYGGVPLPTNPNTHVQLLINRGYTVGYSNERKDPLWVAYHLRPAQHTPSPKRPRYFFTDPRTTARVTHNDYMRTDYNRGHMAPYSAIQDRYGDEAGRETFRMSNIIPMTPMLNQRVWARLEEVEAGDYPNRLEEVWIITGPIFDKDIQRLPSGVEIPDAAFKILVDEVKGVPRMLAFIMPEKVTGNEQPQQYLTSVDEVEKETGIDFFPGLPDDLENRVEADMPKTMW